MAAEQAKIEDSNIANYGSLEHKDLRRAAAASESEFKDAGRNVGIEVWRIEKFAVRRVPHNQHGTFYQGDSYIVLHTYKEPDKVPLRYNVHFWLGKDTTQDEYGTAAYKTVELDDSLRDLPVQYREVQGEESHEFRSLFPRMIVLAGGVDSGFNNVKPEQYRPRLLHVKGKNQVMVREVACRSSSLNEGDCFILDAGLTLWLWNGPSSNHFERRKASEMINVIKEERHGKPASHVLDGLEDHTNFWTLLGGKPDKLAAATPDVDIFPNVRKLLRISDKNKQHFVEEASGELLRSKLDGNDAFIVDVGVTVYIWIGRGSSVQERKNAMNYGQEYLSTNGRSVATPLVRVIDGSEPAAFWTAFEGRNHVHENKSAPVPAPAGIADQKENGKASVPLASNDNNARIGVITVVVHEAKQLKKVQLIGRQDLYVAIQSKKQKFKTQIKQDANLAATWNETFKIGLDGTEKEIVVTVVDENIFVDKSIGSVSFPIDDLLARQYTQQWFTVRKQDENCGDLCLSISYTPPLVVVANEARGLRDVQMIGKQDPYVRLRWHEQRYRSAVHEDGSTTPVWKANNAFALNTALFEGIEKELLPVTIEVWDDNVMVDKIIAVATVGIEAFEKAPKQQPKWFPLFVPDKQNEPILDQPAGEISFTVL